MGIWPLSLVWVIRFFRDSTFRYSNGLTLRIIMNKITSVLGASVVACMLAACASPPPEVSASVPLLTKEATFDAHYLPADISASLESALVGTAIQSGSEHFMVTQGYVSALGLSCKKILVSSQSHATYKTAACKNDKGWFTTPSLMPLEVKK